MKPIKSNYVYLRVSSDHQSYEHQKESIDRYCKNSNITYKDVFADYGISAYSTDIKDRPALMELLALSSEGMIDKLIVFESSRLARNNLQMQILINQFTNNGVQIISVTEGILNRNNEIDELLSAIRGFNAQSESRKLSQRTKSAKELLKKQGKHIGAPVLWGYKRANNGTFVVDRDTAPIVVGLFEFYLNNGSKPTIEYLNKHGKKITYPTQLFYYLKHPMYKGVLFGQYYKDLQIVSTELWERVQDTITSRTTNKDKNVITDRTQYLCESLLFCNTCNKKLFINTSRNSNSYSYRKRCKCTGQRSFSIRKLDKYVDYEIKQYLDNLDIEELKRRFEKTRSTAYKKLLVQEKQLSSLLATKKKTLTNAQNKLQEALSLDYPLSLIQNITDSIEGLKKAINDLETDLQALNVSIKNEHELINQHNTVSEKLFDFRYLYNNANSTERKNILRELVERIIIGEDFNSIKVKYKY